jgi:nicotinate-nucleotide adenylyltransferase
MARRIGVLGGTFDPPHVGHLILAQECWHQLRLDELRLVPAAVPPHKPGGTRWDAAARARMVARAVEGHPGLTLSRAELDRDGASFTVDTLEGFAAAEPDAELWLVIGADQLLDLHRWRRPERIAELARLAVAERAGGDAEQLRRVADEVAPGRVDWVRMPRIDISSSWLRERIDAGAPLRYLVPPGVEDLLRA